jgi:general L-amino acid transport system substrate-binding protein
LKCGVNADLPGFSTTNSLDEYSGFETDLCRSVAAAALWRPLLCGGRCSG